MVGEIVTFYASEWMVNEYKKLEDEKRCKILGCVEVENQEKPYYMVVQTFLY